VVENQLLYVENLPRYAAEFGKLAHGIWTIGLTDYGQG